MVDITEGGGQVRGKGACSLIWKGIEYIALKANILKTFFDFAKIPSTMDAYQFGDFTGSFVSSQSQF